jgi:hypothetical protein
MIRMKYLLLLVRYTPYVKRILLESEVSLQLQRFFSRSLSFYPEVRMRSVFISRLDDGIKEAYDQGVLELEQNWRCGTAFTF